MKLKTLLSLLLLMFCFTPVVSGLLKSNADDYHKVLVNALSKEQSKSAKLVGLNASQQAPINEKLFARDNLMAWCIVPFDAGKRSPEQRARMLKELGIKRFAYDYRAEHIPTFEREIVALKENGIELSAWWFPMTLNDEAKMILALCEKHQVHPQLWVMGGGNPNMTVAEAAVFASQEADRIREIAIAAKKAGCKVGLYNHGGWFGKPENQIELIRKIDMPNVGIVFNLHHSHDELDRLPAILELIKPHLLVLNINGMQTDGERKGKKILPVGEGDRDREVLQTISASGYSGPIGILNHTDEDARKRLEANLVGLETLVSELSAGKFKN